MIYLLSDPHGDINHKGLKQYLSEAGKDDLLILLGDICMKFEDTEENRIFTEWFLSSDKKIAFIDGNHENFKLLNKFPITNMFNAKMHLIAQNIYHVMRGEIMIINDLKFLCIGGAVSIDKIYRKKGVSYWDEENISKKDIDYEEGCFSL